MPPGRLQMEQTWKINKKRRTLTANILQQTIHKLRYNYNFSLLPLKKQVSYFPLFHFLFVLQRIESFNKDIAHSSQQHKISQLFFTRKNNIHISCNENSKPLSCGQLSFLVISLAFSSTSNPLTKIKHF